MNTKLKIFENLEAKEMEEQLSTFLANNVKDIIELKFYQTKISKVVNMFEVEIDGYSCHLLYVPLNNK